MGLVLTQAAWGVPIKYPEEKVLNLPLIVSKKTKPIRELKELRDQHAKRYLNDDGSRTVDMSRVSVYVEVVVKNNL